MPLHKPAAVYKWAKEKLILCGSKQNVGSYFTLASGEIWFQAHWPVSPRCQLLISLGQAGSRQLRVPAHQQRWEARFPPRSVLNAFRWESHWRRQARANANWAAFMARKRFPSAWIHQLWEFRSVIFCQALASSFFLKADSHPWWVCWGILFNFVWNEAFVLDLRAVRKGKIEDKYTLWSFFIPQINHVLNVFLFVFVCFVFNSLGKVHPLSLELSDKFSRNYCDRLYGRDVW